MALIAPTLVGKGAASLSGTEIMALATVTIAANAPLMNLIMSSTWLKSRLTGGGSIPSRRRHDRAHEMLRSSQAFQAKRELNPPGLQL
ncbi:hypothetical protein [Bradyrhizobium sp. 62]|uniref:hypothetical protein n=1 Tax=Bradyrhizobium sp. 62 TaxID=1043588 RepID=UPI001FF7D38F|nr:hypothetical protein [Bradyrhizobium sp. 62]MCK1369135.1 hypothetical protein [Bradyrhizobium sp. 62]